MTAERLRDRLAQEAALLRKVYPAAVVDADALVVILPAYELPPGWTHHTTDVLFQIPVNYPAGQPDNICVRPDLGLAHGAAPGNCQGLQTHAGRPWLQFSYHMEPGDWQPKADPASGSNLVDYLSGALTRFQEAS